MALNNEQRQMLENGARRGQLRMGWNWKLFLWKFLLIAILTLGLVFSLAYLIVRDNTVHNPVQNTMYDREARAEAHQSRVDAINSVVERLGQ